MKIAVAGGLKNFLKIEKYDSMENDPKDATELKIAVRHISLYMQRVVEEQLKIFCKYTEDDGVSARNVSRSRCINLNEPVY